VYKLNVMKVSVNSMCVRVMIRAAGVDFEEEDVYGKTRSPEYIAKCAAHHAPLLESADLPRHALPDSAAIMQYLCNKHQLETFYPSQPGQRAMIDAALGYHSGSFYPMVGKVVYPLFGFPPYPADLRGAPVSDVIRERGRLDAQAALPELLNVFRDFFMQGDFIGDETPSIADIRLVSTLEWLPAANFVAEEWVTRYMHRLEQALGQAYAEPAQDVRDFVAYNLSSRQAQAS
jgi:glutathione S-transferase